MHGGSHSVKKKKDGSIKKNLLVFVLVNTLFLHRFRNIRNISCFFFQNRECECTMIVML